MSAAEPTTVVTIGVPVYRGVDFVGETLRSITDQAFQDYRVLISVDGGDLESAEACRPFLSDSRFELVVQPTQLGWAGNVNWLVSRCSSEFFCFWQQDDLADINYLGRLVDHCRAHPEVVCAYADVQWFGARIDRAELASVQGFSLSRALALMTAETSYVAFLGLMRRDALRAAGPLRTSHALSSLEDMAWILKLAAEGELHRVPDILYFKRSHRKQTHRIWDAWPEEQRRTAWLNFGVGLIEALFRIVSQRDRRYAIDAVLARLTATEGRLWHLYAGAGDDRRFAADFLHLVLENLASADADQLRSHLSRCIAAGGGADSSPCLAAFEVLQTRGSVSDLVVSGNLVDLDFSNGGSASALLRGGWSFSEPWGVWSDGQVATVQLPLPRWKRVHALVRCQAYGAKEFNPKSIVRVRRNGVEIAEWVFDQFAEPNDYELDLTAGDESSALLEFLVENPVAPSELGGSSDDRQLGIGLRRISFVEPAPPGPQELV